MSDCRTKNFMPESSLCASTRVMALYTNFQAHRVSEVNETQPVPSPPLYYLLFNQSLLFSPLFMTEKNPNMYLSGLE